MICNSSEASGRLNAFQRLMLQWSELHPYNAVHVYRIARPLAHRALVELIRQAHLATELGFAEVDVDGLTYRCQADLAPEVEVIWDAESPESALAEHVTRELNRPFDRPRGKPWRFRRLEAEPGSHYVILTYDHWIADSVAARLVMRHVLDRYCGWNRPENRQPLERYPGTYREVFSHRFQGARLLGAAMRSLGQWMNNRSVAQVPYSSSRQMDVRFELYRAAAGTVPLLRHFARSQGATVNDVILAALGRAMAEFLPRRARADSRRCRWARLSTRAATPKKTSALRSDRSSASIWSAWPPTNRSAWRRPLAASPPPPVRSRRGGRTSIRC